MLVVVHMLMVGAGENSVVDMMLMRVVGVDLVDEHSSFLVAGEEVLVVERNNFLVVVVGVVVVVGNSYCRVDIVGAAGYNIAGAEGCNCYNLVEGVDQVVAGDYNYQGTLI